MKDDQRDRTLLVVALIVFTLAILLIHRHLGSIDLDSTRRARVEQLGRHIQEIVQDPIQRK